MAARPRVAELRAQGKLRPFETRAHLDVLEHTLDTARLSFQHAGVEPVRAEAAAAAAAAIAGAKQPPAGPALEQALASELARLYALGYLTVESELHHQRHQLALPIGLSASPPPPNLRQAKTNGPRCASCEMFDSQAGVCWGYGNHPVEPDWLCDSYSAAAARQLAQGDQEDDGVARRAELAAQAVWHAIWQAAMRTLMLGNQDPAKVTAAAEQAGDAALRQAALAHAGGILNGGRQASARAHADEIVGARYTAVLDRNTCLSPSALVQTAAGEKRAADVTLADALLTHTGRYVRPSAIVVSDVEEQLTRIRAGGRALALTADHPVLVRRGEAFVWRPAGQLVVGDFVAGDATLEDHAELRRDDVLLVDAPDSEATRFDVDGLAPIDIRTQRVPVAAVGLNHERSDEEVDNPRADLRLCAVAQPETLELVAHSRLDGALTIRGAVATERAEASVPTPRRDDAKLGGAVCAADDDGRPSARFAAIAPPHAAPVAKRLPAPRARRMDPSVRQAAVSRAIVVPVGVRDGDGEGGAAADARLRDAVGSALRRAVCAAPFEAVGEALAAPLAHRPRVLRSEARAGRACEPPAFAGGASSTPDAGTTHRPTAAHTHVLHDCIVCVRVDEIERIPYRGDVYDFTVPSDHTFWAEGLLVHNCSPCALSDDGVLRALDDPVRIAREPPNPACEGGDRCRCIEIFELKSETPAADEQVGPGVREPVAG